MNYDTEIVASGIDVDVAEDILINMEYNTSISKSYGKDLKIWYSQKDKLPFARYMDYNLEIKVNKG